MDGFAKKMNAKHHPSISYVMFDTADCVCDTWAVSKDFPGTLGDWDSG